MEAMEFKTLKGQSANQFRISKILENPANYEIHKLFQDFRKIYKLSRLWKCVFFSQTFKDRTSPGTAIVKSLNFLDHSHELHEWYTYWPEKQKLEPFGQS